MVFQPIATFCCGLDTHHTDRPEQFVFQVTLGIRQIGGFLSTLDLFPDGGRMVISLVDRSEPDPQFVQFPQLVSIKILDRDLVRLEDTESITFVMP
jgi:hypothetical protein